MNEEEEQSIKNWIEGDGRTFLVDTKPDSIVDAEKSKAVRLRWYNVDIGDSNYLVGLNLHYNGASVGAVWVKNHSTESTMEFHPMKEPKHGFDGEIAFELTMHVEDETMRDKILPPIIECGRDFW